jgi:small subunit ribosomal protein S7
MELNDQIKFLFNNKNNQKLLSLLNFKGQKYITYKFYFQIIAHLKTKNLNVHPIELINKAIENVKPTLEVQTRKRRNFSTKKPRTVSEARKLTLAIRWILLAARARKGNYKTFWLNLAEELINCYNSEGVAIKQKKDLHKYVVTQKRFLSPY